MRALALDFDGVISDSVIESFVVAVRAWGVLAPETGLREEADALFQAGRAAARAHRLYAGFVDLMPLGNRAEDFFVALECVAQHRSVRDQAHYDQIHAECEPERLERFHRIFYAQRDALSDADRARWLRLLGPFPGFIDILRRHATDVTLALATAKDRRSVEILLEAYGIHDLFPRDRVLDKETGRDKRAHLVALSERLALEPKQITFIDDKLNHLESVSQLGVRCVLAAWGYNGERERREAAARGHLVCTLESCEAQLFGDG